MASAKIICGQAVDELRKLEDNSIHCCVTSPPYWQLRDYQVDGQLGLEKTVTEYVANQVEVFEGVRRVLRKDGTLWFNCDHTYNSYRGNAGGLGDHRCHKHEPKYNRGHGLLSKEHKNKDMIAIPWLLAIAFQQAGWYLRSDIIWYKPNPLPRSFTDRVTNCHEYVFMLSKSAKYFYDAGAVKEEARSSDYDKARSGQLIRRPKYKDYLGQDVAANNTTKLGRERVCPDFRNLRSVWEIGVSNGKTTHYATYPEEIPTRCILAGCPEGGTVLDPYSGSGTTGVVALRLERNYVGIDLKPEYCEESRHRLWSDAPLIDQVEGME